MELLLSIVRNHQPKTKDDKKNPKKHNNSRTLETRIVWDIRVFRFFAIRANSIFMIIFMSAIKTLNFTHRTLSFM